MCGYLLQLKNSSKVWNELELRHFLGQYSNIPYHSLNTLCLL